jgi:hypothetical protein
LFVSGEQALHFNSFALREKQPNSRAGELQKYQLNIFSMGDCCGGMARKRVRFFWRPFSELDAAGGGDRGAMRALPVV